jgi:ComF family protein
VSGSQAADERRVSGSQAAAAMLVAMVALLRPVGRLLDLALPPACAGCGREGDAICPACLPSVGTRVGLPPGSPLGLAEGPPDPLLQLEWCSPFAGTTRRALHALKYAGERRLAAPLGAAVAERWRRAGAGGELFVPVPVHEARRRERGYDQAALIAEAAAARLGMPWSAAVVRTRATTAQYRLDRRHRASNVADAFAVDRTARTTVAGCWVVLVDDVVTTGATLCASARALLEAGATAVSAVTVARER